MTRTIFIYRNNKHEKLNIENLRQGDIIRIYYSDGIDYSEYYIACDSWGKKFVVSDKMNIYDFENFMCVLPTFNRVLEVI